MTTTPTILNISQINSTGLAITVSNPVGDVKGFQIEVKKLPDDYLPLSTRNKLELLHDYMLFVGAKDADEAIGERNTNIVFLTGYQIGDNIRIRIRNVDILDVVSDWLESDIIIISSQEVVFAPTSNQPHNFNFFTSEFNLYNSLQAEVIKMRGIDVLYLPKQFQKVDLILGEDVLSKFDVSYSMKMYLASFSEFGGDGSIFGQFGLTVNDQATFEVNITEFNVRANNIQPVEGDLIFVPMGNWLMDVFHFKKHDPFFHMGKPSKYVFETRKYEYSNEEMLTGIDEIDTLNTLQSTDIDSENDQLDTEIDNIVNSTEPNIFGDI